MPPTAWDPGLYDGKHAFVWKHGESMLELLAPRAGERIVDLGCGTGHLAAKIAEAGAEVIGIDSSPAMIEQARQTYPRLHFEVGDARTFTVNEPVQGVFSNAMLHWIKEPTQVIARVHQALAPGGRFVAEFGGCGNVRLLLGTLAKISRELGNPRPPMPWYYPSIAEYAGLLEQGGLEVEQAILFDRPTPLEGEQGLRHWIAMFGQDFVRALPGREEEFLGRMEEELRPQVYQEGVWVADYRRLRVFARKL